MGFGFNVGVFGGTCIMTGVIITSQGLFQSTNGAGQLFGVGGTWPFPSPSPHTRPPQQKAQPIVDRIAPLKQTNRPILYTKKATPH
jgi:hypothetical protein